MVDKKKLSEDKRTGGSNRRKDFHKKIAPWCKKHLKSGHPWDGSKVYGGLGIGEKKTLTCDACGKKVSKTKGKWSSFLLVSITCKFSI